MPTGIAPSWTTAIATGLPDMMYMRVYKNPNPGRKVEPVAKVKKRKPQAGKPSYRAMKSSMKTGKYSSNG